mmetsp:Transcript_37741/g.97618  ORF Transcript_37741/g.97618 Transcript_37741/m.97618 type:complete len:216 (+) Transcript_37741:213-860(+)
MRHAPGMDVRLVDSGGVFCCASRTGLRQPLFNGADAHVRDLRGRSGTGVQTLHGSTVLQAHVLKGAGHHLHRDDASSHPSHHRGALFCAEDTKTLPPRVPRGLVHEPEAAASHLFEWSGLSLARVSRRVQRVRPHPKLHLASGELHHHGHRRDDRALHRSKPGARRDPLTEGQERADSLEVDPGGHVRCACAAGCGPCLAGASAKARGDAPFAQE